MRPLRYSINVTLDGCCDHREIPADEELHRHAVENLEQAAALLFGRVTNGMREAGEMMEAGWRSPWTVPVAIFEAVISDFAKIRLIVPASSFKMSTTLRPADHVPSQ